MIELIRFQEMFLPVFEEARIYLFIAALAGVIGVLAAKNISDFFAFGVAFVVVLYAGFGTFVVTIADHSEFTMPKLVVMAFSVGMSTSMMHARSVMAFQKLRRAWRARAA